MTPPHPERGEGGPDGQLPDAGRGLLQRHQGLRPKGNLRGVRQGMKDEKN